MIEAIKRTTLAMVEVGEQVVVQDINTEDEELKNFLFTLGCYKGESLSIVSKIGGSIVVVIKDARYSIDEMLAEAIII